jgi:hypothetical protein
MRKILAFGSLAWIVLGICASNSSIGQDLWSSSNTSSEARTIVLGFDGLDPRLTERWMNEGKLPNFKKLAAQGSFQPLPTTNPAQSPVAWASFATGKNPGEHGLFDFLRRNPESYSPEYSIATTVPGRDWEIFGMRIPITGGTIVKRMVGEPFWLSAENAGLQSTVLRVPASFPPDNITRMLSGMGVPDLLGTQGTFTIYSVNELAGENARVKLVRPIDGRIETTFEGPADPLKQSGEALAIPLVLEETASSAVKITIDDSEVTLPVGTWSEWIPIEFPVLWPIDVPRISGSAALCITDQPRSARPGPTDFIASRVC